MKYNKEIKEILNTITKDFYLLKGILNNEEATKKVFGRFVGLVVENHKEELKKEYVKKHNLINNNFNDFMQHLAKNGLEFNAEIFEKVKSILNRSYYEYLTENFEGFYFTDTKLINFIEEQEQETRKEIERFIKTERNAQIELLKSQKVYSLNLGINYKNFDDIKAFYINGNYYQFLETEEGKTLEFVGRNYIRKTDNPQDYIFNLIDIKLNQEDIKAFNLSRGFKENNYCFIDDELKFKNLSYSYLDKNGNLRFKSYWFYRMRYNTQTKEFFDNNNGKIDFNNLLSGASEKVKKEFWEIINHAKILIERG